MRQWYKEQWKKGDLRTKTGKTRSHGEKEATNSISCKRNISLSLSLSLSHTHTHTHTLLCLYRIPFLELLKPFWALGTHGTTEIPECSRM
jgi:hypothetical protein